MNRHLSSEQISEWMLGLRRPEAGDHMRSCVQCRNEVEALTAALGGFRQDVRRWSGEHYHSRSFLSRPALRPQSAYWASLAVALCFFFSLLVLRQRIPEQATNIDDAALLSQVKAQLSESVPSPLEPLALHK